jgi:hypothetical protein
MKLLLLRAASAYSRWEIGMVSLGVIAGIAARVSVRFENRFLGGRRNCFETVSPPGTANTKLDCVYAV